MSRAASEKTQLRNALSREKEKDKLIEVLIAQRDEYRVRATKAEQEAAAWRERFDLLLRKEPPK